MRKLTKEESIDLCMVQWNKLIGLINSGCCIDKLKAKVLEEMGYTANYIKTVIPDSNRVLNGCFLCEYVSQLNGCYCIHADCEGCPLEMGRTGCEREGIHWSSNPLAFYKLLQEKFVKIEKMSNHKWWCSLLYFIECIFGVNLTKAEYGFYEGQCKRCKRWYKYKKETPK